MIWSGWEEAAASPCCITGRDRQRRWRQERDGAAAMRRDEWTRARLRADLKKRDEGGAVEVEEQRDAAELHDGRHDCAMNRDRRQ